MHTDQLERDLPRFLEDLANEHNPDYYDELFWQTARTSQRSAWTIRERWLPMLDVVRQPVAPRIPWRPVVLLLAMIGALAASLLLAAARPKLPPLTGPVGNGLVVLSRDGDILTFDPRTGETAVIVTGPEIDSDPIWSQDGTQLLFRRSVPDQADAAVVMIVHADGSGIRQITPEPMIGLASDLSSKLAPSRDLSSKLAPSPHYLLSSDAKTVALIATVKGIPALFVADADGRSIRRLDIHAIPLGAAFDPTGREILFVGAQGFDGSYGGLYIIGVDGSNLRTLIEPQLDAKIWSRAEWSPDGTQIAYARWEPSWLPYDLRVHVMDADGTGDRIVGHQDGTWWEAPTGWSPDGHRLLIERSRRPDVDGAPFVAAIVDVDGQTPDVMTQFESPYDWFAVWSPDGTTILATPSDSDGKGVQQQLWDARTGDVRPAPWAATSFPAWQRVAP